ncbi:MAG: hypothetical protein E7384_07715 [Ruminococcaceae bacterium]|nr:hypothetical protein [Oscillospiraceae bacterium]
MKRFKRLITLLLCLSTLLSFATPYVATAETTSDAAYRTALLNKGFPESYVDSLVAVHKEHPSWVFEPYITNLTWAELFAENAEMYPKRNLVSINSISSWLANDSRYYDPATNTYTAYDTGSWAQVSVDLLEYYMDPRNFLDSKNIFQFESLSYDSNIQTLAGVNKILQGTFMYNTSITDGSGKSYTYADAIIDAAEQSGASPYYIATKIRFEQGSAGTSPLIAGNEEAGKKIWAAYQEDLAAGLITAVDGASEQYFINQYSGLYNYFNMGASGTGKYAVYTNGLNEARSEGWTNRYAAIIGGAKKAAASYINVGQDTYYLQKFNVTSNSNRYYHQYMQAVQGSYSLARTSYGAYNEIGAIENPFTFSIPVYLNMPETACPQPTASTVANTLLNSLSVSNSSAINFEQYNFQYTMIADATVSSVKIDATALYSEATIAINGTTIGKGSVSYNLPVTQKAVNTATIDVTSPNGTATYTLTIVSDAYLVEGTAVNGKVHFGNLDMAAEYTYVENVEAGRGCGVTFIPNPGYVLKSVTRSDGATVEFARGNTETFSIPFTMPQDTLSFSAVFEEMFPVGSTFSLSQLNDKMYIDGLTTGTTVSSLISSIRNESNIADSVPVAFYNANNTEVAATAAFADGMYVKIGTTNYYPVKGGDIDGDGSITIADAALVRAYMRGKATLTSTQKILADIDSTGTVNILDIMSILNKI